MRSTNGVSSTAIWQAGSSIVSIVQPPLSTNTDVIRQATKIKLNLHSKTLALSPLASGSGKRQRHDSNTKNLIEALQAYRKLKYSRASIPAILHLCEILYIQIDFSNTFPEEISKWHNLHYQTASNDIQEILSSQTPQNHPRFWSSIKRSVLLADFHNAISLLSRGTPTSTGISTQTIILMLTSMPISSSYSLSVYQGKLLHWRKECEFQLTKLSYPSLPNDEEEIEAMEAYKSILKILTGDEEEIAVVADDWKAFIVGLAVFKYADMSAGDLSELLDTLPEGFDVPEEGSEGIIAAFLKGDVNGAVRICSGYDWMLTALISDVLEKAGVLGGGEVGILGGECGYSEWLFLNFVDTLLAQWDELWETVLDLLKTAPVFGKRWINGLITRVKILPLDERAEEREKVAKVLSIAEGGELADIHAQIGRACLDAGMIGEAVMHYGKAGRDAIVEGIAKGVLDRGKGEEVAVLVDCVGDGISGSPTIEFLKRYRDFHKLYEDKEYRSAAQMLCLLLTSGIAPRGFWMKLLFDSLPLLEGQHVWFGTSETYELMRCLEECCTGGEGEGIVRLALTRNLSRAVFTS